MEIKNTYSLQDIAGLFDADITTLSNDAEQAVLSLIEKYYVNLSSLENFLSNNSINHHYDIWRDNRTAVRFITTMTVIKGILTRFLNYEGTLLADSHRLEIEHLTEVFNELEGFFPYNRKEVEFDILRQLRKELFEKKTK